MHTLRYSLFILALYTVRSGYSQSDTLIRSDSVSLCILRFDYLTFQFKGGNISYFKKPIRSDTLPFSVKYRSPSDVGRITFTIHPTMDTIFDAGIFWNGLGSIYVPDSFQSDTPFYFTNNKLPLPQIIEYFDQSGTNGGNLLESQLPFYKRLVDSIWLRVGSLNITHAFAKFPYKAGIYDYTPTVGIINPLVEEWIVFLYTDGFWGCFDSTKLTSYHTDIGFEINKDAQCINENQFSFTDTSHNNQIATTRTWIFGDNENDTSFLVNPIKIYSMEGIKTVKLIVSNNGCIDSLIKTLVVYAKPDVDFTINDSAQCIGIPFEFTSAAAISNGSLQLSWDPGNGIQVQSINLTHTYSLPGVYQVKLLAESDHNCKDSLIKSVVVYPKPALPEIKGDTITPYYSTRTYFTLSDSGSIWNWIVTNDLSHDSTTADSIRINWRDSVSGKIQVVETSGFGCKSDTATLVIYLFNTIGLNKVIDLNDLVLYPHPANKSIQFLGNKSQLKNIQIHSTGGILLKEFNQQQIAQEELSLIGINPGIYLLEIINIQGRSMVKKLTIVND